MAICVAKRAKKIPRTRVCGICASESSLCARCRPSDAGGRADPKEMETDMENGVKDVKTPVDGDRYVKPGPRITGTREKTRRGTASHKTEVNDGRGRANLVRKNGERQKG